MQKTNQELAVMPQGQPTETERMFTMIERMASDPACEPAKLRELLSVKQNWEADEARKAFAAAMATFQSRCPIIERADTANGRSYARIDRIHRETRSLRAECGLWFVWNVCEIVGGEMVHLEGILGHSGSHQIPIKQTIPLPDKITGTNSAQRAGSAQTYAKRYGELAALNIVTGEDDDGGTSKPRVAPNAMEPEKTDNEIKPLIAEIWKLMKPVRGTAQNWITANQFLWKNEILDGGIPEEMPNLNQERLEHVILVLKGMKL